VRKGVLESTPVVERANPKLTIQLKQPAEEINAGVCV